MKLLLDENLPPRLVSVLTEFPGSTHVSEVGLSSSADEELWRYAREHGFTLISKDADFLQMSFLRGFPPKIVWIRKRELLRSGDRTSAPLKYGRFARFRCV